MAWYKLTFGGDAETRTVQIDGEARFDVPAGSVESGYAFATTGLTAVEFSAEPFVEPEPEPEPEPAPKKSAAKKSK